MSASATASGSAAQGPIPIIIITGFIDEQEDKTYEAVYISTIPTTGRGVYRIRYEGDAAYLFRPTPNATLDPFIHGEAPTERPTKRCEIQSCEYCALCAEYGIDAHAQQESLIVRGGGFGPWDPYFHWIPNEQLLPLAPGFVPGRGSRKEGKCWIDGCDCRVTSLSTSDSDTCHAPPSIPETRAPSPEPFSDSPSGSPMPCLSHSAASIASSSSKMSEDGSSRRPKDATPHAESNNESNRRSDHSLGCPCKQVEKNFDDQNRPYHFACECDWWDHTPGHADVERRMQKPRYPVTACRRYNMHRYMSKRRTGNSNACSFCRRKSELLAKGDAGFWAAPKSNAEQDHFDVLFRRITFALSPHADDPKQKFVSDDWDSCEDFFYILPESAMPATPPPQARGSLFEWWLNQVEPVDPPPGGRRELVKVSIWKRIKIFFGYADNPNVCKNCKLYKTRCECEKQ
ncbi:hypothetical protein KJ359_009687 [Pestalotiopsis sp. 9143b]|nr:hypothetical protein KJ359_009687 [Pestalotiopsis sp. 9143b]